MKKEVIIAQLEEIIYAKELTDKDKVKGIKIVIEWLKEENQPNHL